MCRKGALPKPGLVHSHALKSLKGGTVRTQTPVADHLLIHGCIPSPGASVWRPLYRSHQQRSSLSTSACHLSRKKRGTLKILFLHFDSVLSTFPTRRSSHLPLLSPWVHDTGGAFCWGSLAVGDPRLSAGLPAPPPACHSRGERGLGSWCCLGFSLLLIPSQ